MRLCVFGLKFIIGVIPKVFNMPSFVLVSNEGRLLQSNDSFSINIDTQGGREGHIHKHATESHESDLHAAFQESGLYG